MNFIKKLKDTSLSVLPVMTIVLILGVTVVPLKKEILLNFLSGGILLILGLTIFLTGVDLGIEPMGERCGAELTKKKNLLLLLFAAFVIGFIVTAAEPDIQVFGEQVKQIFPYVNKISFTFVIAAGVGLFITLGLLRIVLNLSIKWTLFILYTVLFLISFLSPDSFFGIAFDSGGATTGPMTVPFIMALGLGVSSVRKDEDNSFGLTGICSIGPVLAVLIYSLSVKTGNADSVTQSGILSHADSSPVFASSFKEALISILPLFALFIVFQLSLLKMTKRQFARTVIGFVYSLLGLTVFLTGVNSGFSKAGSELGKTLGVLVSGGGAFWMVLIIALGLIFGAVIVCAEPAVWVLSEQVEAVSGGTIKRKSLLIFLSIGTSLAIGLSLLRSIAGFNLKWILIPGYAVAMLLLIFCPPLFSGIAFDSGGVASGPLTSTFVLSFTIGAASANSGSADLFGVIALVAMMPLIAIQFMGIIYTKKSSRQLSMEQKQGGAV